MKKLFACMAVALFATGLFAQAQTEKKAEAKPAAPKSEVKTSHSDYVMMQGKMMHCMGEKQEAMTKDVTLKNGATVSTKGEVTMKDGKKMMLKNGQCVDMNGKVGAFDEMHKPMKNEEKSKM